MVERGRVARALQQAGHVMRITAEISEAIGEIAKKHEAKPSTMALATMTAAYAVLKFSMPPWEVEKKFYEAASLAREIYEYSTKQSKQTEASP